jgi:hypothetical protein
VLAQFHLKRRAESSVDRMKLRASAAGALLPPHCPAQPAKAKPPRRGGAERLSDVLDVLRPHLSSVPLS